MKLDISQECITDKHTLERPSLTCVEATDIEKLAALIFLFPNFPKDMIKNMK